VLGRFVGSGRVAVLLGSIHKKLLAASSWPLASQAAIRENLLISGCLEEPNGLASS
jgi:hypothetical protein